MRDVNQLTCAPPVLRVIDGKGMRVASAENSARTLKALDGGTPEERSRALLVRMIGSANAMSAFLGNPFANAKRPQLRIIRGGI